MAQWRTQWSHLSDGVFTGPCCPSLSAGSRERDAEALYVTALAPGLDPTAIQLTVQDHRLTIAGEKPRVAAEIQPDAFHRSERAAGTFVRTVTLPIDVEHAQVQAEYTNGLLVVTLPKAAHVKPTQIAVSVAG